MVITEREFFKKAVRYLDVWRILRDPNVAFSFQAAGPMYELSLNCFILAHEQLAPIYFTSGIYRLDRKPHHSFNVII